MYLEVSYRAILCVISKGAFRSFLSCTYYAVSLEFYYRNHFYPLPHIALINNDLWLALVRNWSLPYLCQTVYSYFWCEHAFYMQLFCNRCKLQVSQVERYCFYAFCPHWEWYNTYVASSKRLCWDKMGQCLPVAYNQHACKWTYTFALLRKEPASIFLQ